MPTRSLVHTVIALGVVLVWSACFAVVKYSEAMISLPDTLQSTV
jgi:hypothetical protein